MTSIADSGTLRYAGATGHGSGGADTVGTRRTDHNAEARRPHWTVGEGAKRCRERNASGISPAIDAGDGTGPLVRQDIGRVTGIVAARRYNDMFACVRYGKTVTILDYEDGLDRSDLTVFGTGLEFTALRIAQADSDVTVRVAQDTNVVKASDGQIFEFELGFDYFIFA